MPGLFLVRIASIKQQLGALTEAADEYKLVLSKSSHYVPALKGKCICAA